MTRPRRLHLTLLEDRLAPAAGDLLRTLSSPAPTDRDEFGFDVAVDGNLAVVGAYGDDSGTNDFENSGAAYVFNVTTGELVATLKNPAPGSGDNFGFAVDISGTRVVVGTPADRQTANGVSTVTGRAYVYDVAGGGSPAPLAVLSNPAQVAGEPNFFGYAVAISGTRVVVGRVGSTTLFGTASFSTALEAAYVFDVAGSPASGPALIATLNNPTPTTSDEYGSAVDIDGNTAVVGAGRDDVNGVTDAGTAYLFDVTAGPTPAPRVTLNHPTPAADDFFGTAVAVDGNRVVVGSARPVDRAGASKPGIAHVFNVANGALLATLNNPSPSGNSRFGEGVGISGTAVVVGAFQSGGTATSTFGPAYLFDLTAGPTPAPVTAVSVISSSEFNRYGGAVAISGQRVVAGNSLGGDIDEGTAFVFDATLSPPSPQPPPATIPLATFAAGGGMSGTVEVARPSGITTVDTGIGRAARTATADVTGDSVLDTIAGAGPGGRSRVVVISGATGAAVAGFDVFEGTFTGGVFVAAVDLNADGKAEVIVTPDRGGGPVVAIYDGVRLAAGQNAEAQLVRFFGIEDPDFRGGARAAGGDVNGDGRNDLLVAAGFGGGPRLAIFDGNQLLTPIASGLPRKLVSDFFVFEETLRNGVFVGAGDLSGDGAAEVVVGGGPGGGPRVFALDGRALVGGTQTPVANFFAGDPNLRGGVRVAVRPGTDGSPTLVTGSGDGEAARVRVYTAATARAAGGPDQELTPFDAAALADGVYVG